MEAQRPKWSDEVEPRSRAKGTAGNRSEAGSGEGRRRPRAKQRRLLSGVVGEGTSAVSCKQRTAGGRAGRG